MRVKNFSKTYNGRRVLSFGDFDFEKGHIYAVIGANGSGKSTLARLLCGIELPDKGSFIETEGQRVLYMPQKNYAFHMSVMNNILLGKADRKRAEMLCGKIGLEKEASQSAKSLSGGQTARMALARTLMGGSDMLILDEPTSAMDISSTALAEDMIKEYFEEFRCCVVMITHSVKQAERVADRVIFMYEGQRAEWGETKSVLTSPKDERTRSFLDFYGY